MADYRPEPVSDVDTPAALVRYVQRELEAISEAWTKIYILEKRHREPIRLVEGLTVLADGTNWNPGSGAGVYTYYDSAWHKLG